MYILYKTAHQWSTHVPSMLLYVAKKYSCGIASKCMFYTVFDPTICWSSAVNTCMLFLGKEEVYIPVLEDPVLSASPSSAISDYEHTLS